MRTAPGEGRCAVPKCDCRCPAQQSLSDIDSSCGSPIWFPECSRGCAHWLHYQVSCAAADRLPSGRGDNLGADPGYLQTGSALTLCDHLGPQKCTERERAWDLFEPSLCALPLGVYKKPGGRPVLALGGSYMWCTPPLSPLVIPGFLWRRLGTFAFCLPRLGDSLIKILHMLCLPG